MNFYTSDLHFFHKNICKLTDRHLVTCQEDHTEWLINLWNNQVKKGDCVYVLGDVSFGNINITENVLTKLNGNIIVIKGNHDKYKDLTQFKFEQLIFDFHDYLEIYIQGVKTCMSHYPMVSWNKSHYGSLMLHGHTHGYYKPEQGKILDVGLDSAYNIFGKHKLFTEKDIVSYMETRSALSAGHHKVTENA